MERSGPSSTHIPFWRDVRVLMIIGQAVFLIVVALVAGVLSANVTSGMHSLGISGSYEFMDRAAGFAISITPIPFTPADSYWRAFLIGVLNTITIAVQGIVFASIVGLVIGIAQLSSNWLIARLAETYVAILRNIPVLLQILFWDQAVFLRLPRVQEAIELPGPVYISNRGIFMIAPYATETTQAWMLMLLGAFVFSGILWFWLKRRQDLTGQQSPRLLIGLSIVAVVGVAGWFFLNPRPAVLNVPELRGLNFLGGADYSRQYISLLFGLSLYTGAFIAENVRGGIQAISRGQYEAGRALGLSVGQQMRLVILPQALRVIIPPTTSQYLNLTKNSSLAIAIGYPDLYNIARTISNQTGQTVPIIGLIMVSYLSISLITSLLMNLYNRSVRLVER